MGIEIWGWKRMKAEFHRCYVYLLMVHVLRCALQHIYIHMCVCLFSFFFAVQVNRCTGSPVAPHAGCSTARAVNDHAPLLVHTAIEMQLHYIEALVMSSRDAAALYGKTCHQQPSVIAVGEVPSVQYCTLEKSASPQMKSWPRPWR